MELQYIVECLKSAYGIEITTLTPISTGADMYASAYKAETSDKTYFVKLKRNHQEVSTQLLRLLYDAGIQQIIPPITTINGASSHSVNGMKLIVYPFVEGIDGFARNLTSMQWISLGKIMRQVHEFEPPQSIQAQIRREKYSPIGREAVRSIYTQMNTLHDETAVKFVNFVELNKATILRLVERAEELSQKVQKQSPHFVLCHSDIHGGNVLIDKNEAIYIIDWDDPIMAPKERDLMFIGGGVANVWNDPKEEEFFYEGYGKTEIDNSILAYYRHERIVEDIAEYSQELLVTKSSSKDRSEMLNHFIAMFDKRGVVEIAFETDQL